MENDPKNIRATNRGKKNVYDFLDEVIEPIEKNQIDTGELFVHLTEYSLFDKKPDYPFSGDKEYIIWPLPKDNEPGEWLDADELNKGRKKNIYIKLETISSLLWLEHSMSNLYGINPTYNSTTIEERWRTGKLFHTRYKHIYKKIDLDDYASWGYTDKRIVDRINNNRHIFNCINLGSIVYEARLVKEVTEWNFYTLLTFGIDCTERIIIKMTELGSIISNSYKEGVNYAKIRLEKVRNIPNIDWKILNEFIEGENSQSEFQDLISGIKKDSNNYLLSMYPVIGSAVICCIPQIYINFESAFVARHLNAIIVWKKYEKYEQALFSSHDLEQERIAHRIQLAMMKEELDWQVVHLNQLLNLIE